MEHLSLERQHGRSILAGRDTPAPISRAMCGKHIEIDGASGLYPTSTPASRQNALEETGRNQSPRYHVRDPCGTCDSCSGESACNGPNGGDHHYYCDCYSIRCEHHCIDAHFLECNNNHDVNHLQFHRDALPTNLDDSHCDHDCSHQCNNDSHNPQYDED